jgi:purine-nucleoside phosphorylase
MSNIYDQELIALGESVAQKQNIEVFSGVHIAVSGPYYFSKAELSMVRGFGADTIGMSTVPEAIVACHMGLKILGIACVTDRAVPEDLEPLSHEKVVEVAQKLKPKFMSLVSEIVNEL